MKKNLLLTSIVIALVVIFLIALVKFYFNERTQVNQNLTLPEVKTQVDDEIIQDENVDSLIKEGGSSLLDIDVDNLDLESETENLDFNESDLNDLEFDEEANIGNEFNI